MKIPKSFSVPGSAHTESTISSAASDAATVTTKSERSGGYPTPRRAASRTNARSDASEGNQEPFEPFEGEHSPEGELSNSFRSQKTRLHVASAFAFSSSTFSSSSPSSSSSRR